MNTREKSYAPYTALVLAQLLFGSLPVIGKVVLAVIPPIGLVGIRTAITCLVLISFKRFADDFGLKKKVITGGSRV